jgi:uncharacterized protein YyaL (SSP411 family)
MRFGWAPVLLLVACARPPVSTPAAAAPTEPDAAPKGPLVWAELTAATFARAKAEKRFVVVDGSAEWCHWCHVMEATTYHDPDVRTLLDRRFIAVKVDVDARPDFEERYQDWGWPATVLLTPDGDEIGKYKGYIAAESFAEILQAVIDGASAAGAQATPPPSTSAGPEVAEAQLESYWDPVQGSWGHVQKVPLYGDNAWMLDRGRDGDAEAQRRALFTLDKQREIIDPVWGGICQYSTNGDWAHPHFEKLMAYQAGAIDNYAAAYGMTGDTSWLRTAQAVRGFVDRFLLGAEGGFFATMDADLNAHDPGKAFLGGHEYYAKSDAERVKLGIPRVDVHEYTRENGLAIAAYMTLSEQGKDPSALATARRAAGRVLETHRTESGGLTHAGAEDDRVLYLADNAAMGLALVRVYEATGDGALLERAKAIAGFMLRELVDKDGGFFGSTPDSNGVGIFAVRRKPFADNVTAIRFLARLHGVAADDAYATAARRALATVSTREAIADRGRMIGDFLLASEEVASIK